MQVYHCEATIVTILDVRIFFFFLGLFCFHTTQLGLIVLIWSISRFHIPLETLDRHLLANLVLRPLVEVDSEAVYAALVHFVGKQESALCIVGKLGEATMAFLRIVSGAIYEKIVYPHSALWS